MDDENGVQPDEGQGATSEAPYAEYLNRIPEEVRGEVEPVFKEWDSNVTKRFQEHADFRKSWEPYEQLGVSKLSTDEVQWLMQFRDALDTPDAIREWYEQVYAPQNGIQTTKPEAEAAPFQNGQPDFAGYEDPTLTALQQQLGQQLGPIQQRLDAFASWQEQQEQQARQAEAERYINAQIEDLKAKHPDDFNEPMVEKLVAQYIDTDPRNAVQRAFADWQSIRSQIEQEYVQSKVNQPGPAESGGVAAGAPEEIKTLARASEIARERLRQSMG